MWKASCCALIAATQLGIVERLPAQAPVAVAPAPTTVWNFLGIPQGINKIKDATSNPFGNHPALERKPPLKRIGDPANLASKNPAIAAAAQIKQEEDLAAQKIKAIKYLATIGCGCYDKKIDPPVKVALMAALDDCTERVRFEAAKAISEAAATKCSVCGQNCCCDEDMAKKLAEVAFERDEHGCCLEASERVRNAAREALMICCRSRQAPYDAMPVGTPAESVPDQPRDVLPQPEQRDMLPEAPMPVPQVRRPNPPALRMPQQQVSQNNQGQLFAPPGYVGQRNTRPVQRAVAAGPVRALTAPAQRNVAQNNMTPASPHKLAAAKSVEAVKPAIVEPKSFVAAPRQTTMRKPIVVSDPELAIEAEASIQEPAELADDNVAPIEINTSVSKQEAAIETESTIEETVAESVPSEPIASAKSDTHESEPAVDDTTSHEIESSPLLRVTVAAKPTIETPASAPTIVRKPVASVATTTKPGTIKLDARIVAKTMKLQNSAVAAPAKQPIATTAEDDDRAAAVRLAVRTIIPAETLKTSPPQPQKKAVEVSTPVEKRKVDAPAASIKLALSPRPSAPKTVAAPSGATSLNARIVAPAEPKKEIRQIQWLND
jgi:hypothetical protein